MAEAMIERVARSYREGLGWPIVTTDFRATFRQSELSRDLANVYDSLVWVDRTNQTRDLRHRLAALLWIESETKARSKKRN